MSEELRKVEIPKTHNELLEFIAEHRAQICSDWELLFDIIKTLDELLKAAEHMCDLHKDTTIILEAVKLQQSVLLKELKSELTFEKALVLIERNSLDGFFEDAKVSSQCMTFIDHLDFDCHLVHRSLPRKRIQYDGATGAAFVPSILEQVDETGKGNTALQLIKNQVSSAGKIEYFRLICDGESFSKTVFNAFNVSLALRTRLVSLRSINSVLYAVPYEADNMSLGHSVLEITPKQYEKIKELLGIGNKNT